MSMGIGRLNKFLVVVLLFILSAAVCNSLKGDFAFRKQGDDVYRKLKGRLEFASGETVDWVYHMPGQKKVHKIGVVYQRKTVVWVDVSVEEQIIGPQKNTVYGIINALKPGEYRIVLTQPEDDNRIIASRRFFIYKDEPMEED
jgi:hypothetical protein